MTALVMAAFLSMAFSSDKPAYLLYNQDGKSIKYAKMMKQLEEADIIFFGELHTDPIAHWLQVEMTKDLYQKKGEKLMLGAEMFEADNQLLLDEYLSGAYKADKFEAEAKLWGNYQTDYKPLVEFAKQHQLAFIATNIPRRYASVVHYGGYEALESLPEEAQRYMAPLPMVYDPEVDCYKNMLKMMGMRTAPASSRKSMPAGRKSMDVPSTEKEMMPVKSDSTASSKAGAEDQAKPDPHAAPAVMHGAMRSGPPMANLPKAQNAKDATMAHFILENWSEGKVMFHFNGEYHSRNFEGIVWHLLHSNPGLKVMTISTVLQKDVMSLEEGNTGIASFVVCVPESMTRTKR